MLKECQIYKSKLKGSNLDASISLLYQQTFMDLAIIIISKMDM